MKITPEDYQRVLSACREVRDKWPDITPATYAENQIGKDPGMRFRWDLLYASKFDISSLYHYANDNHIDTILRRIVSELYPA